MKQKNKIKRTNCKCAKCRAGCEILSGYLLPDDLPGYMAETWQGEHAQTERAVFHWAEKNLLASEGAKVARHGPRGIEYFSIPTLVPATRENGHCIHYRDGLCAVHQASPAGCKMFNACAIGLKAENQHALANELQRGLAAFWGDDTPNPTGELYKRLWGYLWGMGYRRENVGELGKRYAAGVG